MNNPVALRVTARHAFEVARLLYRTGSPNVALEFLAYNGTYRVPEPHRLIAELTEAWNEAHMAANPDGRTVEVTPALTRRSAGSCPHRAATGSSRRTRWPARLREPLSRPRTVAGRFASPRTASGGSSLSAPSRTGGTVTGRRPSYRTTLADVRRGLWSPPTLAVEVSVRTEEPIFHEFASEWYAAKKPELCDSTAEAYLWHLRDHLLP